MSEAFPPILCRGCGKDGLSMSEAKRHQGKRHSFCRGGPAFARDKTCKVCGEEFIQIVEVVTAQDKLRKVKRPWKGREIYQHKINHIRAGDEADE